MDVRLFVSHSFWCIEIYLVLHDSYKIKKMCEFIKLMNREVYITYSQNRCPDIDITDTNAFILFSKLSYIPCTCTKFYYNYNSRCLVLSYCQNMRG